MNTTQSSSPTQELWTHRDFLADKIPYELIGTPKDGEVTPIKALTTADIKRDALQAYRMLGGVVWLKKRPRLYSRLMIQALSEKPLAPVVSIRVG